MLVTPYYPYAHSLPHDYVIINFQIVKFDYFMPIYVLSLMLEVYRDPAYTDCTVVEYN